MDAERRKFMRFDTELGASYQFPDERGKGHSEVKNLSRGGLNIALNRELDKGTEVELNMMVPGDNVPIFASAQVAWNKKSSAGKRNIFSTGLKFTKIDNYDRARLLDYVYSQWLKMLKQV